MRNSSSRRSWKGATTPRVAGSCSRWVQVRGLHVEGRAEEGTGRAQRVRPGLPVRVAATGVVGLGQQHVEGAGGKQGTKGLATLGVPLAGRVVAVSVVFLPAEQGAARGSRGEADQEARVGKEALGFRKLRGVHRQVPTVQGRLGQPFP